jgi:hypothetical protein
MQGIQQVMVRRFEPTFVFQSIQKYRATDMCVVPTMANALLTVEGPMTAKFECGLDAGGDLFDLPGCVRAGIFETGFELSWVFVFDGQRLHSAPHARRLKDRAAHQIANQRF